jgi:hypothetical protein
MKSVFVSFFRAWQNSKIVRLRLTVHNFVCHCEHVCVMCLKGLTILYSEATPCYFCRKQAKFRKLTVIILSDKIKNMETSLFESLIFVELFRMFVF